ncbi:MAG: sigma 54-interacting transcriptional regulator [Ignavibacteriaceae bacterium]|nr:sigma 54-interacting transcriptional regulator [Ignavibacteriaceae bacterium]
MKLSQDKLQAIVDRYKTATIDDVDHIFEFIYKFEIIEVKDENDFWHASPREKFKFQEYLHICLDRLPQKLMFFNQGQFGEFMQDTEKYFLDLRHKELKVHHSKNIFYQKFPSKKTKIKEILNVVDNIFETYSSKKRSNICFIISGFDKPSEEIAESLSLHLALKAFCYILNNPEKIKFSLYIAPPLDDIISPQTIKEEIKSLFIQLIASNRNMNESFSQLSKLMEVCTTRNYAFIKQINSFSHNINNFDQNILITGAKGTGKSRIAKEIHKLSNRSENKFFNLNCATLKEAELTGWKKGAFTDAKTDRPGYFRTADKGTLFFDEIARTKEEVRNILIKFVQEKEFIPLGSDISIKSSARLIFGTNADLQKLITEGNFEPDFYDRINQIKLYLPELKDRIDDIPLIIDSILIAFNHDNKTSIKIESEAINYMKHSNWPGNIRELESYLRILLNIVAQKKLNVLRYDLCLKFPVTKPVFSKDSLAKFESLLLEALNAHDSEDSKFLEVFIFPILSKIFIEDFQKDVGKSKKKYAASHFLGLDGSKFAAGTLEKYYNKYKETFTKN